MLSTSIIQFKNVSKLYGKAIGISNISFDVNAGEIFGFLGPNGAGKTTSISLMLDLIRPSKGKISIFNLDSQSSSIQIHQRVGFLSDDMALEKSMTGWQQLEYFGHLRGNFDKKRVSELAKRFNSKLNRKIKTLSRGNRQKIGLISALMHDPELLILDEPTSGLDPLMQQEFNKIILERKDSGKTTFISSHILSEVQEICDRAGFIRDGQLVAVKSLAEMGKNFPKHIHLHTVDKTITGELKKLAGVTDIKQSGNVINFLFTGNINRLLLLLSKHKLASLTITEADLETLFMQYYGK